MNEMLWIYTHVGAFRFLSGSRWEALFDRIVKSGWKMSSAGDTGWLQSELNPYPVGALLSAADAKSFSLAINAFLTAEPTPCDTLAAAVLEQIAELFSLGPILIRSEPPRKTVATSLMEVTYGYSCLKCGFLHSGSWLFNIGELTLQEIRSSVESMLKFTYCPLCGSKDIIAVTFFLLPFDPEEACDFMAWSNQPENEA